MSAGKTVPGKDFKNTEKSNTLLAWCLRSLTILYFIIFIFLFYKYLWSFISNWISEAYKNSGDIFTLLGILLTGFAILILPFIPSIWFLNWADDLDRRNLWKGLFD